MIGVGEKGEKKLKNILFDPIMTPPPIFTHYPTSLSVMSKCSLDTSRDGDATTPLGAHSNTWPLFQRRNFS